MYKNQSKPRFKRREIQSHTVIIIQQINKNKNVYNWIDYKYYIKSIFFKNINNKKVNVG